MNQSQADIDPDLELTVEKVARDLRGGSIQLIDVREQDEWDAGRIAGSTLVPMSDFARHVSDIDPSIPIVTVCQAGVRSLYVAEALANAGFTSVRSMTGGISAWLAAGLPVEV